MGESKEHLDVQLLQAKWVLGGVEPEQLVQAAVLALKQGFDGTALRQLAGLSRPASRDLGRLPARAFAEMGLQPSSEDEAVSILLDRDEPRTSPVISSFRHAFPDFLNRWRKYIGHEGGNSCGSYIDMAEVVHFVVEDVYENGNIHETRRIFEFLEQQLLVADEETRNLIGLGFFETLQCFASWRQGGNRVLRAISRPHVERNMVRPTTHVDWQKEPSGRCSRRTRCRRTAKVLMNAVTEMQALSLSYRNDATHENLLPERV
jgi:hypothetical protein